MKAAFALVCLALAQGISASIFKRSHRPAEGLIVQPHDYINQYQQPLYQPQELTYQEYILQQRQQQQQLKQKKHQKYQYSSASSSQETSQQDNNDWNERQQYVKARSSGQKWNKPLFTAIMKVQNEVVEPPTYGQNGEWPRGIQVPLKQKKQQQQQQQLQQQQLTDAQQQEYQKIYTAAQQAMIHATQEQKEQFQLKVAAAVQAHNEDDHLNVTDLVKKYGYSVEEHTVTTDDGYVLGLFRIPANSAAKTSDEDTITKLPVLAMHGYMGSADDWTLMGPGKSLAFMLSDAGYDVWLGNVRGNKYSRSHVSKHPELEDFWQFSIDEVALHDLPAIINYVLNATGKQKLNYIGQSLGATAFFAMVSEKPEYNGKIVKMAAIAPTVYMGNTRSPLINMMSPKSSFWPRMHHELGRGEFNLSQEQVGAFGGWMLENEIGSKDVANNAYIAMSGVNVNNDASMYAEIIKHLPAGTPTRMIKQLGQQKASDKFTWYDYVDPATNEKVYGSTSPRIYNLKNVNVPVMMTSANKDLLVSPVDVKRLGQELPNATTVNVQDPFFSHPDYLFNPKAVDYVYKPLIKFINEN